MDTNLPQNVRIVLAGLVLVAFAGIYYYRNPEIWIDPNMANTSDLTNVTTESPVAEDVLGESSDLAVESTETVEVEPVVENTEVVDVSKVYVFVVDGRSVSFDANFDQSIGDQMTEINGKTVMMGLVDGYPMVTVDGDIVDVTLESSDEWFSNNSENGIIWEFE